MEYNEENLKIIRDQFNNFNNLVADERGYIAFKIELLLNNETKTFVFTVEEILAMMLANIKLLAEKQSKESINDVIIAIPNSFTMNQRKMINDAVDLAGLK